MKPKFKTDDVLVSKSDKTKIRIVVSFDAKDQEYLIRRPTMFDSYSLRFEYVEANYRFKRKLSKLEKILK